MSILQDPQLLISKSIEGYRILELLRDEPYAYVYLSENQQGAFWFYVLKSPDGRELSADKFRQSFFMVKPAQGHGLLGVQSFNKVSIPGVADDLLYVVYERASGQSLRNYLSSHEVSYEQAFAWTKSLLQTLSQLHGQRIFHHALSLDNVWIDDSFQLKVGELGLASVFKRKLQSLSPNSVSFDDIIQLLRAPFVSPEEIKGKLCNQGADLYSAGVVGYLLFSQQLPIEGESQEATLRLQLDLDAPLITDINPILPEVLDDIFKTALAKDAKDRFVSAQAFINAFENVPSRLDVEDDEDLLGFSQSNLDQHTFVEYGDVDEKTFFEEEEGDQPTVNQILPEIEANPTPIKTQPTPVKVKPQLTPIKAPQEIINDLPAKQPIDMDQETFSSIMELDLDDESTVDQSSVASNQSSLPLNLNTPPKTIPFFGTTPAPQFQPLSSPQVQVQPSLLSNLQRESTAEEIMELADETNSGHLFEASRILPIPQLSELNAQDLLNPNAFQNFPQNQAQNQAQFDLNVNQSNGFNQPSYPEAKPIEPIIQKVSANDWPGQQNQYQPVQQTLNKPAVIVQKDKGMNFKSIAISVSIVLVGVLIFAFLGKIQALFLSAPKPEKILIQSSPPQIDVFFNNALLDKTPFEYSYPEDAEISEDQKEQSFSFMIKPTQPNMQPVRKELAVPSYPGVSSIYLQMPRIKTKELVRYIIESSSVNAAVSLVEDPKPGATNPTPTIQAIGFTPLIFFGEKNKEYTFQIQQDVSHLGDPSQQPQVRRHKTKLTGLSNDKVMIDFQNP